MAISVMTLNLWNDSGPYDLRRERIREWIDRLDPDLIGFQEALRRDGRDQVTDLLDGRAYAIDYVRASAFADPPWHSFGNAIASRWPIVEREELALPDAGDGETRAALSVIVDAPIGRISLTSTHLNWKLDHGWVRERQVIALADLVMRGASRVRFPAILVGDLNAEPDSAEIRYLRGLQSLDGRSVHLRDAWTVAGQGSDGVTWSNRNPYAAIAQDPDRRIDYILTGFPEPNGIGRLTACRVVCNDERDGVWPSDHFGVHAELRSDPIEGLPVHPRTLEPI
jgi:endonuclease/exonuclease/phosphatase family metal-dependent hydrolase